MWVEITVIDYQISVARAVKNQEKYCQRLLNMYYKILSHLIYVKRTEFAQLDDNGKCRVSKVTTGQVSQPSIQSVSLSASQ